VKSIKTEPTGVVLDPLVWPSEIVMATQALLDQLEHTFVAVVSADALAQVYSKARRRRWWREVGNVDPSVTVEEFALRKAFDACLSIVERTVDTGTEWRALADANYWLGMAHGFGTKDTHVKVLQSKVQTRRAILSGSVDRASKEDYKTWYEKNRQDYGSGRGSQAAAIRAAALARLAPIKESSIKRWFAEWDRTPK